MWGRNNDIMATHARPGSANEAAGTADIIGDQEMVTITMATSITEAHYSRQRRQNKMAGAHTIPGTCIRDIHLCLHFMPNKIPSYNFTCNNWARELQIYMPTPIIYTGLRIRPHTHTLLQGQAVRAACIPANCEHTLSWSRGSIVQVCSTISWF